MMRFRKESSIQFQHTKIVSSLLLGAFLDCMLPIGMENGKLPDSAFTASRFHSPNPPKEARLNTGKSWCAPQDAGKNEYLQVDLGAVINL